MVLLRIFEQEVEAFTADVIALVAKEYINTSWQNQATAKALEDALETLFDLYHRHRLMLDKALLAVSDLIDHGVTCTDWFGLHVEYILGLRENVVEDGVKWDGVFRKDWQKTFPAFGKSPAAGVSGPTDAADSLETESGGMSPRSTRYAFAPCFEKVPRGTRSPPARHVEYGSPRHTRYPPAPYVENEDEPMSPRSRGPSLSPSFLLDAHK